MKKLYRSTADQRIAGVIGGLAEYFEVDSNLLRVIWIFFTVFTGLVAGTLIYILAIFILPRKPPA